MLLKFPKEANNNAVSVKKDEEEEEENNEYASRKLLIRQIQGQIAKDQAPDSEYDSWTDLEENFVAKTRSLMLDNNTDLEVEIDVLRDRLQREGVRLETKL